MKNFPNIDYFLRSVSQIGKNGDIPTDPVRPDRPDDDSGTGACCIDGVCSMKTREDCEQNEGSWYGEDWGCSDTLNCAATPPILCEDIDGNPIYDCQKIYDKVLEKLQEHFQHAPFKHPMSLAQLYQFLENQYRDHLLLLVEWPGDLNKKDLWEECGCIPNMIMEMVPGNLCSDEDFVHGKEAQRCVRCLRKEINQLTWPLVGGTQNALTMLCELWDLIESLRGDTEILHECCGDMYHDQVLRFKL